MRGGGGGQRGPLTNANVKLKRGGKTPGGNKRLDVEARAFRCGAFGGEKKRSFTKPLGNFFCLLFGISLNPPWHGSV